MKTQTEDEAPANAHLALMSEPPMLPMVRSAKYMGICRSKAYELHRLGQFPIQVLAVGNRYRCRRIDVLAYLGLTSSSNR